MVFVGRSQTLNFEVRALQNLYISFKTLYFHNSLIMILHNGGFRLFTEYFQILRRACLTPGDARSPPMAPKTIAVYIFRLEKIMKMIAMKKRNIYLTNI